MLHYVGELGCVLISDTDDIYDFSIICMFIRESFILYVHGSLWFSVHGLWIAKKVLIETVKNVFTMFTGCLNDMFI